MKKEKSLNSKLVKFSAEGLNFTRVEGFRNVGDIFLANSNQIQKLTNSLSKN